MSCKWISQPPRISILFHTTNRRENQNSTHRKLEEKTGIFTFIGIGKKGDPTKTDLSIQVYLSPELYDIPRY